MAALGSTCATRDAAAVARDRPSGMAKKNLRPIYPQAGAVPGPSEGITNKRIYNAADIVDAALIFIVFAVPR